MLMVNGLWYMDMFFLDVNITWVYGAMRGPVYDSVQLVNTTPISLWFMILITTVNIC